MSGIIENKIEKSMCVQKKIDTIFLIFVFV
jgi:hypothetical protein